MTIHHRYLQLIEAAKAAARDGRIPDARGPVPGLAAALALEPLVVVVDVSGIGEPSETPPARD